MLNELQDETKCQADNTHFSLFPNRKPSFKHENLMLSMQKQKTHTLQHTTKLHGTMMQPAAFLSLHMPMAVANFHLNTFRSLRKCGKDNLFPTEMWQRQFVPDRNVAKTICSRQKCGNGSAIISQFPGTLRYKYILKKKPNSTDLSPIPTPTQQLNKTPTYCQRNADHLQMAPDHQRRSHRCHQVDRPQSSVPRRCGTLHL